MQYQKMIRAITFRMTGSQDDAEELARDAFLRAYRQLGSFRGGSKFSTWLYKIAINLSLGWRRREIRRDCLNIKWAQFVWLNTEQISTGNHLKNRSQKSWPTAR
jgi:RNA polymerase sigma-70 factor (ECF subfamily)